jgi:arabinoxylan arabinofuranohydrolase
MNYTIKIGFTLLSFLGIGLLGSLHAQNPIIQTNYTADAASLVHNDRFYIYAGRDEASPTGGWYYMREWRIYSSDDMVNWTDHGPKLRPTDFSWASGDAWASECIYHKGKFYWYITAHHKELKTKAIGVAVSDSPTGPFVVASEKPLITSAMSVSKGGFSEIDPTVFVDDDGQAYLYWGNGVCKYVKLNEDMISFSGEIQEVKLAKYGEAPWLQKINNTYYLSYSSNSPSTIEYATGPSATGPWEYKNRILEIVENCVTSHQAISEFKGKWYLVYHNGTLPEGGSFRRSVCIDEFSFNPDGSIPMIKPTKEGIQESVSKLNPYKKTEAETMAWGEGVKAADDKELGVYISNINNGDYIKVRDVDFGKGAKQFFAQVASTSNCSIEIRLGGIDGALVGTCNVNNTGGLDKWSTMNCKVKKAKGIHNLYFVFKGGEGELLNFDWWKFL